MRLFMNSIFRRQYHIMDHLLKRITSNKTKRINFAFSIDETQFEQLMSALKNNTSIKYVALHGRNLQNFGTFDSPNSLNSLTDMLKVNTSINLISFVCLTKSSNKLIKSVFDALTINKSLTTIGIMNCKLTSEDCKYMANTIKTNTTLTSLSLTEEFSIGNNGCKFICDALKENTYMHKFTMRSCGLSIECANHISDMLLINTSLQYFNMFSNSTMVIYGYEKIFDALKTNTTLKELHMDHNCHNIGKYRCSPEDKLNFIKHTSDMLKMNTSLNTFLLNNPIYYNTKDSNDWDHILDSGLEANKYITKFNIITTNCNQFLERNKIMQNCS